MRDCEVLEIIKDGAARVVISSPSLLWMSERKENFGKFHQSYKRLQHNQIK